MYFGLICFVIFRFKFFTGYIFLLEHINTFKNTLLKDKIKYGCLFVILLKWMLYQNMNKLKVYLNP